MPLTTCNGKPFLSVQDYLDLKVGQEVKVSRRYSEGIVVVTRRAVLRPEYRSYSEEELNIIYSRRASTRALCKVKAKGIYKKDKTSVILFPLLITEVYDNDILNWVIRTWGE